MNQVTKDLVLLVADKNIEAVCKGLLLRPQALGIRSITFDIFVHPHKDPGCLGESATFLQSFVNQYQQALVIFDREGCGSEKERATLEAQVEAQLMRKGWAEQAAAIVLDPELEVWVWTKSAHVSKALGWSVPLGDLHAWLVTVNYLRAGEHKPSRPKEAMEAALRQSKKPRSSAIYQQLANNVSLQGHQEPAFVKFQTTLQSWFPPD